MAGARVARKAPRRAGLSRTAWGAAVCRLIEQGEPSETRLFTDPVVGSLLDPATVALAPGPMRDVYLAKVGTATYGAQIMRTRYIDDVVTGLVEGGVRQVVILGAGLDTRAFRMRVLADTTVFELDLPDTQQYKVKRLRGVSTLAAAVRFIPTDFTSQPLGDVLDDSGLDRTKCVLFVCEGVTQYVPDATVRSILTCVGTCAPGSALVFTYVQRSVIDDPEPGGRFAGQPPRPDASEPWIFGLAPDEVPGLLDSYGLELVDDVSEAEFRSRYAEPLRRHVELNDVEHVALAVVRAT